MKTYYQITCELYQEHVVPVINAKQLDSGRGVDITLTDCGAVVVPQGGDVLNLYCKKEDGTVSYIAGALNGDAVRVDFTNTLLAVPGVVECELEITSGAETVSTPVFRMVVLPSNIDPGAIISTDEFTALDTALMTVSSYDQRITDAEDDITALEGRMTTAESGLAKFKIGTKSGTTTNAGNLSIGSNSSTITILAAWGSGMCIPFIDSSNNWYVKVLGWSGTTYSPVTSTAVTVDYLYREV